MSAIVVPALALSGFVFEARVPVQTRSAAMQLQQPSLAMVSRRELISTGAALATIAAAPGLASAESTMVTRQQAYTRYVPRIERGRDYWATGLRKIIAAGQWDQVIASFEKKGSADRIFGPMELYASSFSGKTIADKTLEMNKAIAELRDAKTEILKAAIGQEAGGGFLGFGGGKKIDESKRREIANAGYKQAVAAINKYIEIGNEGLGILFATLDTIDD